MGKSCDDCGADGEALQCICDPADDVAPANRVGRKSSGVPKAALPHSPPKSRQAGKHTGSSTGKTAPALSKSVLAPQSSTWTGPKVICCRCKHVHLEGDRLNEWGQKAGKVVAGRRTECPNKCGYHVTIPVYEDA